MFQHPSQELIHLLSLWGYPVMLLLMILEGPIATIVSAFLASLGYFNVAIVFALSVIGDVVGDIILYYIGFFGGQKIIPKVQKFLGVKDTVLEKLKAQFHKNSERIIFYVKSTTGLSYIAFITAGTLRMRFAKFVKNSILGGFVWSGFLVAVGYFFGYAAERISRYIQYAGIFIFILAISTIVFINVYKKKRASKIVG